jgi:hypothetical protein
MKHVLAAAAVLCLTTPAHAWTGRVDWTTWLRAGPGLHFTVLDEISGGDTLEVLDCDAGWCRTMSDGAIAYIQAERVSRVEPQAGNADVPGPCVDSRRAGYEDGELFRYCQK